MSEDKANRSEIGEISEKRFVLSEAELTQIDKLNELLSTREPALGETRDLLESIRNPILVDFNGIFANNSLPLVFNEDSRDFLDKLRLSGTVVIVSTASSAEFLKNFLEDNDLWKRGMVLMVRDNYEPFTYFRPDETYPESEEDYWKKNKMNTSWSPAEKRIAQLFGEREKIIPLIDDYDLACSDNPGIRGIWVKTFSEKGYIKSKNAVDLNQAARIVNEHYD